MQKLHVRKFTQWLQDCKLNIQIPTLQLEVTIAMPVFPHYPLFTSLWPYTCFANTIIQASCPAATSDGEEICNAMETL